MEFLIYSLSIFLVSVLFSWLSEPGPQGVGDAAGGGVRGLGGPGLQGGHQGRRQGGCPAALDR